MFVRRPRNRLEAGNRERSIVDCGLSVLLEIVNQPPSRDPRVAPRIPFRDQDRQLKKLTKSWASEFAERRLGDEQVTTLDRSVEDRSRMSLAVKQPPSNLRNPRMLGEAQPLADGVGGRSRR
jgi:hypothetical protein